MTKSHLCKEGVIWLTHSHYSPLLRNKQKLKQRPWRNDAPHGLLSLLFLVKARNLLRSGTTHRGLGPAISGPVTNQTKYLEDLPIGQYDGGNSSVEVLSSRVTQN